MTKKEFKNDVYCVGKKLKKDYKISINFAFPTIAINTKLNPKTNCKNVDFFAQGEDASTYIDEIPKDFNPEYYLLWYFESAGIFQKDRLV